MPARGSCLESSYGQLPECVEMPTSGSCYERTDLPGCVEMPARGSCLESGRFSLDKKGNEEKKGEGLACGTLHSAASPTWGATWSHVGSERCCSRGAGRGREAPATGSSDWLTAEEARALFAEAGPEEARRGDKRQRGEGDAGEGGVLVEQDTGKSPAAALRGEDQTGHKPCVARRVSLCGHQHGPEEAVQPPHKRRRLTGKQPGVQAPRPAQQEGRPTAKRAAEGPTQPQPRRRLTTKQRAASPCGHERKPAGPRALQQEGGAACGLTAMGARDKDGEVECDALHGEEGKLLRD